MFSAFFVLLPGEGWDSCSHGNCLEPREQGKVGEGALIPRWQLHSSHVTPGFIPSHLFLRKRTFYLTWRAITGFWVPVYTILILNNLITVRLQNNTPSVLKDLASSFVSLSMYIYIHLFKWMCVCVCSHVHVHATVCVCRTENYLRVSSLLLCRFQEPNSGCQTW